MARRTRKPGPIQEVSSGKNRIYRPGQSEWISIDIMDGTWTENDPNSTLVSKSVGSGGMTISLESDRDSDTWSSAAQTCVRWYKMLFNPSGTPMKWEDEFGVEFLVRRMSTTANDENFLVACLSDDPTDTSNQAWAGMRMTNDSDGDLELQYGGDQDLVKITGDSGDLGSSPRGYVNCMLQIPDDRSSDAIEPIGVAGVLLDNDNDVIGGNMGNNGQNVAWNNSNNVYLVVAAGWTASGASSDSSAVWKAWYRVTHSHARLDPLYIPGGGSSPRGGVNGNT